MPISLEALTADDGAVERLAWWFDLRLKIEDGYPEEVFTIDGTKDYRRFARDGAGGTFALLSGSPRILYGSSEGEAGIIAADFDEFVRLIVACPYWNDVLKFSGNGDLAQMRRAAAALAAYNADDEDVAEAQSFFASQFALTVPADPVGALHRAVSSSDVVVRTHWGEPYLSLFGARTVDVSPFLRNFAD